MLSVCGLVKALSLIVSVPLCAPRLAGVSVSPMAHTAPAASWPLVGHGAEVELGVASARPVPVKVIELMFSGINKLFLRVNVFVALISLITTLLKYTAAAESFAGRTPVPLSVTGESVLVAVVVTVSELAASAPSAVGVNDTPILQVAFFANVPFTAQVVAEPTRA
jgi:hypothetical protein